MDVLIDRIKNLLYYIMGKCYRCHGRMEVGFTTTYGINAYPHKSCEFEFHSWQDTLYPTVCDKVWQ